MLIFTNPYVSIELTNNSNSIKLTWTGLVPAEFYKEALEIALKIAVEHQITNWITDAQKMLPISVASQDWVISNWFPRAVASGCYKTQEVVPPKDIAARSATHRMVFLGKNEGVEFINSNYKRILINKN